MKKSLNPGDTIWLNMQMNFMKAEPSLKKCVVTRSNQSSVYVRETEREGPEYRLSVRNLTGKTHIHILKGYLTEDEYWIRVEQQQERSRLADEIRSEIGGLSLEQLRRIKEEIL